MLEIIYDAHLIQLPEDFTFFGVKAPVFGANLCLENFSERHPLWDGSWAVVEGSLIGHYHCGEANGFRTRSAHNYLEFIVPVNAGSTPYIEKLAEADGLYMQGHFFETLSTFITSAHQHVGHGRFRVPPNHFYFLGEHNVV